jgi:hypothetical protein
MPNAQRNLPASRGCCQRMTGHAMRVGAAQGMLVAGFDAGHHAVRRLEDDYRAAALCGSCLDAGTA